jgi:hypothetical protein
MLANSEIVRAWSYTTTIEMETKVSSDNYIQKAPRGIRVDNLEIDIDIDRDRMPHEVVVNGKRYVAWPATLSGPHDGWHAISQQLRGTGRSTTMLLEALKTAQGGKRVSIAAATEAHAKFLFDLARKTPGFPTDCGRVRGAYQFSVGLAGTKIDIMSVSRGDFNWNALQFMGDGRYGEVLVDHWTIEQHFQAVLIELFRYCGPGAKT